MFAISKIVALSLAVGAVALPAKRDTATLDCLLLLQPAPNAYIQEEIAWYAAMEHLAQTNPPISPFFFVGPTFWSVNANGTDSLGIEISSNWQTHEDMVEIVESQWPGVTLGAGSSAFTVEAAWC